MTGPGKYDEICTGARAAARAGCVLLIVIDGKHGGGFSVQCDDMTYVRQLPSLLRYVAEQIEHDNAAADN